MAGTLLKSSMALALSLAEGEGGAVTLPDRIPVFPAPGPDGIVRARPGDDRQWRLANAAALAATNDARETALMVDYDHLSEKIDRWSQHQAVAAGWVGKGAIEIDEDGSVWARPEWTPAGAKAIAEREYRYISPAFLHDDDGNVVALTSIALVNNPAFAMQALAAHEDNRDRPPSRRQETETMDKAALAELGLPEDATPEQVLKAIAALKKPDEPAAPAAPAAPATTTEMAPAADLALAQERATAAEARLAKLEADRFGDQVDAVLDKAIAERLIALATRDYHRSSCFHEGKPSQDGFKRLQDYVKVATPVVAGAFGVAGAPPPASTASAHGLTDQQVEIASKFGRTPEQYAAHLAELKNRSLV